MGNTNDQILWYNNGTWGELGFAVPNFGDDPTTINSDIHYLVSVIGRNLQGIMLHTDASQATPPSINTLTRVHKLVTRGRSILAGRAVPPNELNMEPQHASPAPQAFLIFPTPYHKTRNQWLKDWGGLTLMALTEAMQHTENATAFNISTTFSGLIGQYLHRIYQRMATELFGVPVEQAKALDFTLTDEQLASYDPSKFFTSTEMTDVVPTIQDIQTEDDLRVLTAGIPATELVGLQPYPSSAAFEDASGGTAGTGGTTSAGSESFAEPPSA
jgi:hypothetical protein